MSKKVTAVSAFVAVSLAWTLSSWAAEMPIDAQRSTIRIHVRKAGLLSAAGHEHWVSAPIMQGSLDDGPEPRVAFAIRAAKLSVEPDQHLSAEQQAEVQHTMQQKVLDSERYPEISFQSKQIEKTGEGTWLVKGDLKLHGANNMVSATVHEQQGTFAGHARFKQTDFGIQPVSIAGGVVKVKDELEIEFAIVPATASGR